MVQWWYVLILCDYVPSGLPGQTLIQLWLQLTNETCVTWLLLIMCLAFYMTAGWGLLRPLSVLLFVYFFNRNKILKYAKTVHKIVHSSCSSEYDNNISHAKTLFLHWKCHINANLAFCDWRISIFSTVVVLGYQQIGHQANIPDTTWTPDAFGMHPGVHWMGALVPVVSGLWRDWTH